MAAPLVAGSLRFRGVDIEPVGKMELGYASDSPYGAHDITAGPELKKVLRGLSLPRESADIDIGCGKGAALITLGTFSDSPKLLAGPIAPTDSDGATEYVAFAD